MVAFVSARARALLCIALTVFLLIVAPQRAQSNDKEADTYASYLLIALFGPLLSNLTCSAPPGGMAGCDPVHYTSTQGASTRGRHTTWDAYPAIPLTDYATVGLIAGISRSNFGWSAAGNTTISSDATTLGWFAAITPASNTMLTISNVYSRVSSDMLAFNTRSLLTTNITMWSAELSHRFTVGQFFLKPSISLQRGWADIGAFADSTNFVTPASTVTLNRVVGSATFEVPRGVWDGKCAEKKAYCSQDMVFAKVSLFHNDASGIRPDPTLPTLASNFVGVMGGIGAEFHPTELITIGADAGVFTGGDQSGYSLRGYVNLDLAKLMGWQGPLIKSTRP